MEQFDYVIIGAGAAGLNLSLAMAEDPYFSEKRILILDKDKKDSDDRTWSFWEKGESKLDPIVTKKWSDAVFYSRNKKYSLALAPYCYKTIRSSDFYRQAGSTIGQKPFMDWRRDEVQKVEGNTVIGYKEKYRAKHVFDGRISEAFHREKDNYSGLIQHFKGWFIRTQKPTFDPNKPVMMDYRLRWKDQTSFTYVLPFSENYALVEFTLFNSYFLSDEAYEGMLKRYIKDYLHIEAFEIEGVEKGFIPMSDYPFHKDHTHQVTKIGTAGGWVRPSSGYSFRNSIRFSEQVVANIKAGKHPATKVATGRFRKYDSIFLDVLKNRNDLGEIIFKKLYTQHPMGRLFRFLDEGSSIIDDLIIMSSVNHREFRRAFFRKAFN